MTSEQTGSHLIREDVIDEAEIRIRMQIAEERGGMPARMLSDLIGAVAYAGGEPPSSEEERDGAFIPRWERADVIDLIANMRSELEDLLGAELLHRVARRFTARAESAAGKGGS